MSQSRVLVVAAIGAALLYAAGAVALGSPPEAGAAPGQVAAWLADHQDGVRVYVWTATFGTLAFAIVAGLVREALPRPFATVFMLGAAAFIVETAIQAWFWGALALRRLDPQTARTVLDVASYWGPVLTGATTTMIGAVTVAGVPRWLRALGVVAFAEQAIETVTTFGTHGFTAPGGPMNLVLGAGLTAAWLLGLVVWVVQDRGVCQGAGSSSRAS